MTSEIEIVVSKYVNNTKRIKNVEETLFQECCMKESRNSRVSAIVNALTHEINGFITAMVAFTKEKIEAQILYRSFGIKDEEIEIFLDKFEVPQYEKCDVRFFVINKLVDALSLELPGCSVQRESSMYKKNNCITITWTLPTPKKPMQHCLECLNYNSRLPIEVQRMVLVMLFGYSIIQPRVIRTTNKEGKVCLNFAPFDPEVDLHRWI